MKIVGILTCAAVLAVSASFAAAADSLDLRVESRVNPLGVESAAPRFSWELPAGGSQAAYQIQVASSAEILAKGQGDLWDSGKVASNQNFQIAYAGKALKSDQEVFWHVTYWAGNGKPMPSDTASFAMGLLAPADWTAKWIGFPNDDSTRVFEPAPCFRHEFALAKPVARATVHVCGLGQYELTLNGKVVGDAVLGPAWTTYAKTASYDTFDVTRQLKQGGNAVGIMLGTGMYNVKRDEQDGRYSKFVGSDRTGTLNLPKAIMQLDIEHTDGTHTLVTTGDGWKTARGPVTFDHTYGGEDYDARREMTGWDSAGFDDKAWLPAAVVPGPGNGNAQLVAAVNPPIKIEQTFKPVAAWQVQPNVWVYDFGQNLSGWPRLKVKGAAGATVSMVPGELLYKDGTVGPVVDAAKRGTNWFTYTLKGSGEEEWRPKFSSYGFRYLEVTGAAPPEGMKLGQPVLGGIGRQPLPLGQVAAPAAQLIEINSQWVHADLTTDGTFGSSDETLNRIHRLIDAAIVSNSQSVLTDCPHREKMGWLEQAQLMSDSIALNYDMSGLYRKICMDIRDAQYTDGMVPTIAPEYKIDPAADFQDSPEWGATAFVAPWMLYQYYGDTRTLEVQYDSMKRYMAFLATCAKGNIISDMGLGDWMEPGTNGRPKNTTRDLTATATYYQDTVIMRKTAEVLGKKEDAKAYADLADQIRAAFNTTFFDGGKGQYETGSQTADSMPLALGMVDPAKREAVVKNLLQGIVTKKYQIGAGDVGFVYVVNALIDAQQGDVMYQMMTQADGPGYVMQLNKGATTLTEKWDGGNASNDHLMLGHGELWFYRGLCGIQTAPGSVAFDKLIIRPEVVEQIAANAAGEKYARASVETVRGPVVSNWSLKGKTLTMDVTVPASSTATIYVPAGDPAAVKVTQGAATIKPGKNEEHAAVFAAEGGVYQFEATLP